MSGRSLVLAVVLPFLALCALALWFTRPSAQPPAPPPLAGREALAPTPSSPLPARPGPAPSGPSAPPPTAPRGEAPSPGPSAAPPPALPSSTPVRSPSITIPEAEPQTQPAEAPVDKEDVRRAIQTVVPLIRQCFLDIAERHPGPQSVTLKFTIEGQGLTGHFRDGEVVDTTLQDPFALACFLDSLLDVRFPAPRGGGKVTVTYPFRFEPKPDAGR